MADRPFPYSNDDFAEAYAATGAIPVDGLYTDIDCTCGCPMAVLAAYRSGISLRALNLTLIARLLEISNGEEIAFRDGFDDNDDFADTTHYPSAYAAGRSARERFILGGEVVQP